MTKPWETENAKPEGLRRRFPFVVRWDHDCPNLGYNSFSRCFATAEEAIEAVNAGMGHCYRATAMDGNNKFATIAVRSNPGHWRNKRRRAA